MQFCYQTETCVNMCNTEKNRDSWIICFIRILNQHVKYKEKKEIIQKYLYKKEHVSTCKTQRKKEIIENT